MGRNETSIRPNSDHVLSALWHEKQYRFLFSLLHLLSWTFRVEDKISYEKLCVRNLSIALKTWFAPFCVPSSYYTNVTDWACRGLANQ